MSIGTEQSIWWFMRSSTTTPWCVIRTEDDVKESERREPGGCSIVVDRMRGEKYVSIPLSRDLRR